MDALHPHLDAAGSMPTDPWKVGAALFMAYVLLASTTLKVRNAAQSVNGFKKLTPPIGGWMMFPIAIIFFPILANVSAVFSIYLLTRQITGHSLARQEWAQLVVFLVCVPVSIYCTISFIRWIIVRRRYNETGLEWGILRFNRRMEWNDLVLCRSDELRGLQLRFRDGSTVKIASLLNGVPELTQMVTDRLAANPA